MTERHDEREDRDNDVVTHDNNNHEGHHAYEVHVEEAEQQIKDWETGDDD